MNVTLNNIDAVNATLTVEIKKEDYAPEVKKGLKKIKDTASIPGFRPGMAPDSMIQKRFGKSVKVEEVTRMVGEQLNAYINENNLNLLGEPLPNEDQKLQDFENQDDFSFVFDLALAPEINFSLTKDDVVPYYNIIPEKKTIDERIEGYQSHYGTYEQANEVEDNDMVKGLLIELNPDGSAKEGGINNENAMLLPDYIKNEEEKAKFMGAKLGDTIVFNPHKAYEGNEAELSSFLKIEKEAVGEYTGDFSLKIEDITRYKKAALNKELYDKIFGEGVVKNKKELETKVKEEITEQLRPDSDYKFFLDTKDLLMDKTKDIAFPDAFLKRWLLESNPEYQPEVMEEEYPKTIDSLRFHLIKNKIVKDYDIKIEMEDIKQAATGLARAQFAQYGMPNVPDNLLENYVSEMLKKEDTIRNLADKVVEDKIIVVLKDKVTLDPKDIKIEDFNKLFTEDIK
jgi:trigger factor